jgi:hypothetical protein
MSPLCQFGDDTALKGGLRSWPIAPEKRGLALEPILDPNAPTQALTLDDAEDGRPDKSALDTAPAPLRGETYAGGLGVFQRRG